MRRAKADLLRHVPKERGEQLVGDGAFLGDGGVVDGFQRLRLRVLAQVLRQRPALEVVVRLHVILLDLSGG